MKEWSKYILCGCSHCVQTMCKVHSTLLYNTQHAQTHWCWYGIERVNYCIYRFECVHGELWPGTCMDRKFKCWMAHCVCKKVSWMWSYEFLSFLLPAIAHLDHCMKNMLSCAWEFIWWAICTIYTHTYRRCIAGALSRLIVCSFPAPSVLHTRLHSVILSTFAIKLLERC